MPDLSFDLDRALKILRSESEHHRERLGMTAAALEHDLRAVAAAIGNKELAFDVRVAASLHVMELDLRGYPAGVPSGQLLHLGTGSYPSLAQSTFATDLRPGRYRVLVQFSLLPDEVQG